MASRRKARILAFQALYAWETSKTSLDELLKFPWLEDSKRDQLEDDIAAFSMVMIAGTIENIDAVDTCIRRHLSHWPFERLKKVDLAILRVGTYCLLFQRDMPAQITIDEAIEIAKEYGSEDSYKFINAVLDGIHKENP
ncbi:MAG TPA: transcription antitermination factor NusB [Spirochaetales bacterium]|nr:transcription antitermination factor NusB [Spirochaetales bacterium]HPS14733.1 transcription antitermination factor NusB [Spirochaetales bacterium]